MIRGKDVCRYFRVNESAPNYCDCNNCPNIVECAIKAGVVRSYSAFEEKERKKSFTLKDWEEATKLIDEYEKKKWVEK